MRLLCYLKIRNESTSCVFQKQEKMSQKMCWPYKLIPKPFQRLSLLRSGGCVVIVYSENYLSPIFLFSFLTEFFIELDKFPLELRVYLGFPSACIQVGTHKFQFVLMFQGRLCIFIPLFFILYEALLLWHDILWHLPIYILFSGKSRLDSNDSFFGHTMYGLYSLYLKVRCEQFLSCRWACVYCRSYPYTS